MREPRRYPQHLPVFRGQLDRDMTAERRRSTPQIHGDIEHGPGRDAHELALGTLDLIVQTAEHAATRARVIVLHELRIDSRVRKRAPIVAFEEKAPRVTEDSRLDQLDVGYRRRRDLHCGERQRTTGSRSNASR